MDDNDCLWVSRNCPFELIVAVSFVITRKIECEFIDISENRCPIRIILFNSQAEFHLAEALFNAPLVKTDCVASIDAVICHRYNATAKITYTGKTDCI